VEKKSATLDITEYKNQLLSEIVNNPLIEEAIASTAKDYIQGQGDTLIGRNVFPMFYVPDIQLESGTYIGCEAETIKVNAKNPSYHDIKITIWVIAHRDSIYWPQKGCSRLDYISDKLRDMLQNSECYGYGTLNLTSNTSHLLNPKFSYRQLQFKTVDLKKNFCR
jgi:hypothetical protein